MSDIPVETAKSLSNCRGNHFQCCHLETPCLDELIEWFHVENWALCPIFLRDQGNTSIKAWDPAKGSGGGAHAPSDLEGVQFGKETGTGQ